MCARIPGGHRFESCGFVSSILFPTSGSSAFQGQLNVSPDWLRKGLGRPGHRLGFDRRPTANDGWEIGPFVEGAWQSYHPKKADVFLDISAVFWSIGLRHKYWKHLNEDHDRVAFGAALSYVSVRIPDSALQNFRLLVEDARAATASHGLRAKVHVQLNDLIAEAEFQHTSKRDDRGTDPRGIAADDFVVRLAATGKVFGL